MYGPPVFRQTRYSKLESGSNPVAPTRRKPPENRHPGGFYFTAKRVAQEDISAPSNYHDVEKLADDGDFITLVNIDLNDYMRRRVTKSIIKTVSLPLWLTIMAEEAGVSYSQTL